jgi:hypothetical protein
MPRKIEKEKEKENPVKKQVKKQVEKQIQKQVAKAVDSAMVATVLARVEEIGLRKAADEAGIAWQTVNKWKKDAEKAAAAIVKDELTTPEDFKEAVEMVSGIVAMGSDTPAAEEREIPAAEEKAIPAADENGAPVEEAKTAEEAAAGEEVAEKPAQEEAAAEKPDLIIESTMGGQISADEIFKRVKEKAGSVSVAKIYVKPEENKAYFTYGDSVGHVDLW